MKVSLRFVDPLLLFEVVVLFSKVWFEVRSGFGTRRFLLATNFACIIVMTGGAHRMIGSICRICSGVKGTLPLSAY